MVLTNRFKGSGVCPLNSKESPQRFNYITYRFVCQGSDTVSVLLPGFQKFPEIGEHCVLALILEHAQQLFQHVGGFRVY